MHLALTVLAFYLKQKKTKKETKQTNNVFLNNVFFYEFHVGELVVHKCRCCNFNQTL